MIYEIEIFGEKEKTLIKFLQELEFVKIKQIKSRIKNKAKPSITIGEDLPYFNTMPDWDMDVREMRKTDTEKKLKRR